MNRPFNVVGYTYNFCEELATTGQILSSMWPVLFVVGMV